MLEGRNVLSMGDEHCFSEIVWLHLVILLESGGFESQSGDASVEIES
jgi:hypothetical protein